MSWQNNITTADLAFNAAQTNDRRLAALEARVVELERLNREHKSDDDEVGQ